MANNVDQKNGSLEKLKSLLTELFQLDSNDLDFGIYRIMKYRRKEINNFIEKDLLLSTEKEFEKYKTQSNKELLEKVEEKERKIKEDFGADILKNGKLTEKYGDTKLVKDYLELKKQLDEVEIAENIKNQVFNDLYNFFSRYYEDGDFIPKRRISSAKERYAIPYNGEEVKLYWANCDQYYVKTGEIFKDYQLNLKGWRIKFGTAFAEVETGNIKGERRYFVLAKDDPVKVDNKHKTFLVQFEYKLLAEDDLKHYKVKTKGGEEKKTGIQQDEVNGILEDKIIDKIKEKELKAILSAKEGEKTVLGKHLYKYTHNITSDFFIHKNLKGFFERELDYFIKTEVVDFNDLEPRHITRARVVEGIGKKIIEFLSQIEEFEKLLWEKKKFVLKTDYVITLDKLPEDFHKEILDNKNQLKDWEELGFGKISKKSDLCTIDLIGKKCKKLPVDTKYFDEDFKERLIAKLCEKENLDDILDGVLIKSENWQALNLILEKYKEHVQCIYIDPPFNTGSDFLYKDKYQNSSWLTLLDNRLTFINSFLKSYGSFFLHLDENANYLGRILLSKLNFGNIQEIAFDTNATKDEEADLYGYKSFGKRFVLKHNTIFYSFNENNKFFKLWKPNRNTSNLKIGWLDLVSQPKIQSPKKITDFEYYIEVYDSKGKFVRKHIAINEKIFPLGDMWNDIYSFTQSEMRVSENLSFLTQKPENMMRRIIQSSSDMSDFVLDYFAGSGTTLATAHKLSRKWIGVEMGDYFNEFYADKGIKKLGILGRLKNVLYGDKSFKAVDSERRSHLSQDINWQGGGFFKYHYLEQHEDALHNIEFTQDEKGQKALELFGKTEKGNEYLMKYFLNYETKGSPSLLNLNQFENPFEYKLKIISGDKGEEISNVDLIETFNYLIGLRVDKYKYIKENGRKYVIVLGGKGNRKVAVVWRPTKDIDLEKDKETIEKAIADYHADEVYINGDAYVKNYKLIESEFKAFMGV